MERKRKHGQAGFKTSSASQVKKARSSQSQVVQAMDVIAKSNKVNTLGLIPEKKFFDTALGFAFDTTGEVPATGQLALIPQGDTGSTRDGRQCVVESIHIRGNAFLTPAASATAADVIFMYCVWDKQANGAAAAVTDVLTSNLLTSAMINLENSDRFIILKKWRIPMEAKAGVTTAYNNHVRSIEWFKKVNIPMQFGTAAVDITQIKSNNIFLLAGASLLDDITTFTGTCRLRFRG